MPGGSPLRRHRVVAFYAKKMARYSRAIVVSARPSSGFTELRHTIPE